MTAGGPSRVIVAMVVAVAASAACAAPPAPTSSPRFSGRRAGCGHEWLGDWYARP
jgi:hypothetical protein